MAVRFITGSLGAGKSYYAVHHIANTYFRYRKKDNSWIPKKINKDGTPDLPTFITNLEMLRLPHINLDDAMEKAKLTPEQFFDYDYQDKLHKKYPKIVYILDEVQILFPRFNKINNNTWKYFQKSRHFGDDLFLITQDVWTVAQHLVRIKEYELYAIPRTLKVMGDFKYHMKTGNSFVISGTESVFPSKKVFALYKSMERKESEKIKNPFRNMAIGLVLFMAASIWAFQHYLIRDGSVQMIPGAHAATITDSNIIKKTVVTDEKFIFPESNIVRVPINYIMVDKDIYIYSPEINALILATEFEYPLTSYHNQRSFSLYADIPGDLLPLYQPPPTTEKTQM